METAKGDCLQGTWIQILKVSLAESVTLGNELNWGWGKDKNRHFLEPINALKWRKIANTIVSVIWWFFPISRHLIVKVIVWGGKADPRNLNLRADSVIIGIFWWLSVSGLFLLLLCTWPWPSSPGRSQAPCNYALLRWKSLGDILLKLRSWGQSFWTHIRFSHIPCST